MALTCPRCATLNPDGNSFCQACGTQLATSGVPAPEAREGVAGPPPGPPVAAAPVIMGPPPNLPPPPYQSPYYAPALGVPQAPVHRTPWVLIVSAVVALVLVMAGIGTAYAVLSARNASSNSTGADLPSPSPAGSPSPIPSHLPQGATTASTSAVTVTVPSGWAATTSDPTVTLTNQSGIGSVVISSGSQNPPLTALQIKDQLDKEFTTRYPDTRACPNSKTTNSSVSGVAGVWWELCLTATSGGQSFPAAMALFAGANADGSIGYGVILLTLETNLNTFINEARPVLASIQWKLK